MKKSEWWKNVEECDHDWHVLGTRVPLFCHDDSKMIEKVKCFKCQARKEREGSENVSDFIEKKGKSE
jgi:hypothetical protein